MNGVADAYRRVRHRPRSSDAHIALRFMVRCRIGAEQLFDPTRGTWRKRRCDEMDGILCHWITGRDHN